MFPLRDSLPRHTFPGMVWTLIAINSAVFMLLLDLPPDWQEAVVYHYGLVPARYIAPEWALAHGLTPGNPLPFFTNMFLHGGWLHLIFNMWTLWIFGPALEDRLGPLRFLVFYLLCGLLASFAHFYFNLTSTIPSLGASGAIAGVIGGYVMLFPHARIIIMVPILFIPFFFEVPALVYALVWYFTQVLQGTSSLLQPQMGGGVAWWAHVGGFLAGLLLIRFFIIGREAYLNWHADEGVYGFAPDGSASSQRNHRR